MNSILAKIAPKYDLFRNMQFALFRNNGRLVVPLNDEEIAIVEDARIEGLSEDPDERENQTILLAITSMLAIENKEEGVTFDPTEMVEAIEMLKLHIHLEEWEERGWIMFNRDKVDEYGFPYMYQTEACLAKRRADLEKEAK